MRFILSLALILGVASGTALLTGCEHKTKTTDETTHKQTTPGGGEKETKTETTTTEKAPKDNK